MLHVQRLGICTARAPPSAVGLLGCAHSACSPRRQITHCVERWSRLGAGEPQARTTGLVRKGRVRPDRGDACIMARYTTVAGSLVTRMVDAHVHVNMYTHMYMHMYMDMDMDMDMYMCACRIPTCPCTCEHVPVLLLHLG